MSSSHLTHSRVVAEIVPYIYKASIAEFQLHPNTDMSRSNKCHTLSKDLMSHLQSGHLEVRRELHQTRSGFWHYVIAHADAGMLPSDEDVITDLSPWFFPGGDRYTGYLHAPRQEVMATLAAANIPAEQLSLRALSTVVLPHSEELLSSYTHPPIV